MSGKGRSPRRRARFGRPGPLAAMVGLLGLAASGPTEAQRVEAVTLSSGGLAEVHRVASLEGDGTLELRVPLEQVNDILKSLVVRDPGGRLRGMRLDGLAALEETFRRLPFGPDDLGSVVRLAATLQGVPVRVASGGRRVEGQLLGVDAAGRDDQGATLHTLAVLDAEGAVATLRLRDDARLEVLDAALAERLRQAVAVSGRARSEAVRRIAIELEGEGERQVTLAYVVAAPVWKTAYRLLLDGDGEARLQAWAVVENASGSDWDGVTLTLASGAPVSLSQRLLERYWPSRPEVPVRADTTAPVRRDEGTMRGHAPALLESAATADASREHAVAAPARPARAMESDTAATWRLPFPVDLEAGRSLSLPYVDAALPAGRVSLFQPGRGERHPVAAVRLENATETWLPPGLVTVYEAGVGHLGDVDLPGVPAGETRLASFAADRKLRVSSESRPEERLTRVTIVDGALRATHLSRVTTRYTVTSDARRSRELLIEHPIRQGWRFDSPALVASTPTHHRLGVTLAPGAGHEVEAREELTRSRTLALVDAGMQQLMEWSEAADEATARRLEDLLEHRRGVAEVERELSRIRERLQRAADHQARLRDNLAAVGTDSDLGQRYLTDLEAQENRVGELESEREAAEARLVERREALAAFLRELD
ncbi:DUF4139 domain-containing protein [Halomonas ramblicola]|uniref:DUF4139 domain-containing protein n=1 Tax=Halomonas ramblicola TaxID=747349 RepID=UPI0025B500DE|nr:DUF4139 domain-containing protein [Halomonas ramblicola]MDN3521008.1 DUF4139 domain-containing protein [Halomonas ramblicola]